MKLSLIQCELHLAQVDKNYETIQRQIEKAMQEKPDILVLPEMWNTSFSFSGIEEIADKDGERTKDFLQGLAKKYQVAIVGGSIANTIESKIYNTSYVYDKNARLIATYNKAHLFSPAGENKLFTPGDSTCTFEINHMKCGLCTCYDLRFPEWIRMTALKNIDILFLPAAWPVQRLSHWLILNRARAIENQIFVACVNSTGKANGVKFVGNSAIIDPWGEYVSKLEDDNGICTADIDLDILKKIRNSINVFEDRRPEVYKF